MVNNSSTMDFYQFVLLLSIFAISGMTIYAGCCRSYVIYFFERANRNLLFLNCWIAITIPIVLSFVLVCLYEAAKREQTRNESNAMKSGKPSRKTSIATDIPNKTESYMTVPPNQDSLLKLPTDSIRQRKLTNDESEQQLSPTYEESGLESRKASMVYRDMSGLSIYLPSGAQSLMASRKISSISVSIEKDTLVDFLLQILGFHLPLWLCVFALYVTITETINVRFHYFYHNNDSLVSICSVLLATSIGFFHEIRWSWFINNVLAIASAYQFIAKIQVVSSVAALLFLVGMTIFDVFWVLYIDLTSLVAKETRAPLMLIIPWLGKNKMERLATLDIVVHGMLLSLIMKFSDMYDQNLFSKAFIGVMVGYIATICVKVHRSKTTPAIVLPAIFGISASIIFAYRPSDLFHFVIRY